MIIYGIVDEDGLVFYVGQTANLRKRKADHTTAARGCKHRYKLYHKLRKIMREGKTFDFIVIENNIPESKINEAEIKWIAYYRKKNPSLCNICDGGQGMTQEMQKKAAEKRRGQKRTKETRKRMSGARKGIKFTDEHKKNLSIKRRQRITTKETKEKMSLSMKGKINIKKFKVINPNGIEFITENGLTSFCEQNNLSVSNMIKVVNGERPHHKGWKCIRIKKGKFNDKHS